MHRRISAYIVDRSASKSTPLNSHLVLNSVMYFRNISTASDAHDHFLGFLIFPHLSESSGFPSCSRRQLVHHHHLFAKWRHCCPPTVPNSLWPAQNGEDIPRAYTRTKPLQIFAAIWQWSDSTKVDPSTRVTLPQLQVFTWQKGWPSLEGYPTKQIGWPYLSCKPNWKIQ